MAINITDGFNVLKGTPGVTFSDSSPIDYRMVAANSAARTSILYKYDGMKVFQLDNRMTYVWNSGTSTWSIDIIVGGTGSLNYIPKVTSTSPYLTYGNSPIYASGSFVGINSANPKEYLQIGSYPVSYIGESLPLAFHKGSNAIIGYNWYYNSGDQYFESSSGSSIIRFSGTAGSIYISTREPSAAVFNSSSFFMKNGKVMVGDPSIVTNDALGGVSFLTTGLTNLISGEYLGLGIMNISNSASNKTSVLSFWGRSTTNVNQRVADIYSQIRGSGPDLGNWTKSSLVMKVINRDLSGNATLVHKMELREDGFLFIGPNSNDTVKIISTSPLFPNTLPKLEIMTGDTSGTYNECMVLRHQNIDITAVDRRLGYLMKMSGENNDNESHKMGGVIVESSESWANSPSLYLVTSDKKRMEIDHESYGGNFYFTTPTLSVFQYIPHLTSKIIDRKFIISKNDILVDIHNVGSNGIGDSGNHVNPWNYQAIASGQYAATIATPLLNCSSISPGNVAWIRVGNVVNVSGRVTINVTTSGALTEFRLTLPINSSFGTDLDDDNSNNWQLNGVGKVKTHVDTASGTGGDVASIEAVGISGVGYAYFKFRPSVNGAVYMTYTYQYILGSWPDF